MGVASERGFEEPFTESDYGGDGSILRMEKRLIRRALMKTGGNMDEAYKLLCPEEKPYFCKRTFLRNVKRHGIIPQTEASYEKPKEKTEKYGFYK